MLLRVRLASPLCVLQNSAHWSKSWAAAPAPAAAAPATPAAAEMLGLRCMVSAPSSPFDSTQVSKAVHARRQLLQRCPMHLFRLRGVTFNRRQDLVKQLMPGQPLMFQQEPSNPADPSAIHVTTLDGASVGYIAQHLTSAFTLPACFGTVASLGVAEDTDKWGVSAACCPVLHGAALDLLPASWQEQTDMQQVFGADGWLQLQQRALERYQQRCAVTSVPASEMALQVVPQWRFDHHKKQVQLAELVPLCEPLLQLQQLVLLTDGIPPYSFRYKKMELHAAAVGLLQQVMAWEVAECERYVLHVQQRQLKVEQDGWQLLAPEADVWLAGAAVEK